MNPPGSCVDLEVFADDVVGVDAEAEADSPVVVEVVVCCRDDNHRRVDSGRRVDSVDTIGVWTVEHRAMVVLVDDVDGQRRSNFFGRNPADQRCHVDH